MMTRLTTIKTLAGFDFTFQPSLDKSRILTVAELDHGWTLRLAGERRQMHGSPKPLLLQPLLPEAEARTLPV